MCVHGCADTRFLLLHDPHKDDNIIKAFFYEVRWTDLHSWLLAHAQLPPAGCLASVAKARARDDGL